MPTSLHILAPGRTGGLESVVRMLATGLVDAGAEVHAHLVVDPGVEPPLAAVLAEGGVGVHVTEVPHRRYAVERDATRRLCRRLGIDVVHSHGYRADVIDTPEARKAGLPVVSTVHGFTGGGWKNAVYEWLQIRALRRMDRVVAVSRPLEALLERRGVPAERIRLLPNAYAAADEPLEPVEAREALGLPVGDPVVGWIGRMSREKAPDVFVAAAGAAPRPGVRWVLVGDGPMRSGLEPEAGADVTFAGLVPEVARLIRAFDVLVLSSRTEGTPIVALEAMAAGVPTVATRVGGVPDLLGGGAGLLVDPDDPDALAGAVGRLLDDGTLRERLRRAARERLVEDYAVGPWVEAHRALYTSVVSQPGPG